MQPAVPGYNMAQPQQQGFRAQMLPGQGMHPHAMPAAQPFPAQGGWPGRQAVAVAPQQAPARDTTPTRQQGRRQAPCLNMHLPLLS